MASPVSAPYVTVLMPVYNGAGYLRESVDSILSQTLTNFEFLIINDGSNDGSADILNDYAARDKRIKIIHQDNQGLIKTLNKGLDIACAPLIARMDADDIALPNRLQRQYDHMCNNPDVMVLGSAILTMKEDGQILRCISYPMTKDAVEILSRTGSPLAHPAVMMRRDFICDCGGYRLPYAHAEDYDLWLRVLENGGEISNLAEPLLQYRQHTHSVSNKNLEQQAIGTLYAAHAAKLRQQGGTDQSDVLERALTWDDFKHLNLSVAEQDLMNINRFNLLYGRKRHSKSFEDIAADFKTLNLSRAVSKDAIAAAMFTMAKIELSERHYMHTAWHAARAMMISPLPTLRRIRDYIRSYL